MTPDALIQGIDYALLRAQKERLLTLIDEIADWGGDSAAVTTQTAALAGIIHLLDAIQDCAEEAGYMPELPCGEFEADFDFDHNKCQNCGFTEAEHDLTITPEP